MRFTVSPLVRVLTATAAYSHDDIAIAAFITLEATIATIAAYLEEENVILVIFRTGGWGLTIGYFIYRLLLLGI